MSRAMNFQITCSKETASQPSATLSSSVLEAWSSLPKDVRAALVSSELALITSSQTDTNTASSTASMSSSRSNSENDSDVKSDDLEGVHEELLGCGTKVVMKPLERAPKNVFAFVKTSTSESTHVEKKASTLVTTKTTVVTSSKGWRNVFTLPISYDVNAVPYGTLLDPVNPQLLEATGVHDEGYNRRFAVIDACVDELYGDKIRLYFQKRGIELTTCILQGGEADKRPVVS